MTTRNTLRTRTALAHSPARTRAALMLSAAAVALLSLPAGSALAQNLPVGGTVANGAATIVPDAGGLVLDVNQTTDRAVIDWQSFNVASGHTVNFAQPSATSVAINRVSAGGGLSEIYGAINANGIVAILNPNGVLFGGGANVNVGGLIASTGHLADAADFMSGGALSLTGASAGMVDIQLGATLTIGANGLAAFVAPHVRNSGVITATGGRVMLGAGEAFTLDLAGDGLLELGVSSGSPLVENFGSIMADGGRIQLSAAAASAVVGNVINTTGLLQVGGAHDAGGTIVLEAVNGDVGINGTVQGGDVTVSGNRIHGAGQVNTGGTLALYVNEADIADTTTGGASWIADALGVIGTVDGGSIVNLGAGVYAAGATINDDHVTLDGHGVAQIDASHNGDNGITVAGDYVTVQNLEIFGDADQSYITFAWPTITRGVVLKNGAEYATVTGNNIHDVRNGVLVDGRNTGSAVTDNRIENTKGAISVQYTDGSNLDLSGNSEGPLGNEWGVNVHLNGILQANGSITASAGALGGNTSLAEQQRLLAMSNANNGMSIQNLAYTASNRTHAYVSTTGLSTNQGSARGTLNTVQGGVDAVVAGGIVQVSDGVYVENVLVNKDNITLLSTNGRDATTIQGIAGAGGLGTVQVSANADNLTLGAENQGFTIVGFDGAAGIETAAVYFQGANSGASLVGNRITANGDGGLMTEYNAAVTGLTVDGNIFDGQTFTGANPAGDGFGQQFTLLNVPRQLVVISQGASNVLFTNNEITGTAGGLNAAGAQQGNTLVTIDASDSAIGGNLFAGTTNRYGNQLRARGTNVLIAGNTFDNSHMGAATSPLYVKNTVFGVDQANFAAMIGDNTFLGQGAWANTSATGFHSYSMSIQGAVNEAAAGGVVQVNDGTYNEHVVVNKADLTLRSVNQYGAVIDAGGTGVGIQVSSAHGALGTVTIDGFSVTNWNTGGIVQGMAAGPLATVHVLNNEVVGPLGGSAAHGNGIQVSGDGSSVIGNTVSVAHLNSADWSGSGILVVNGSDITVSNNVVSDADVGIGVMNYNNAAGMTGVVIEDNLVSGASEGVSIQAYGGQIGGVEIVNNDIGGNEAGLGVWDFGSGEGVWADTIGSVAGNTFHDNTVHASSDFVDAAVVSLLAGNDFDQTVHAVGGATIYGDLSFAASDAAADSHLILSGDTFVEDDQILIDRNLTITGVAGTVVEAGRDFTGATPAGAWWLIEEGVTFALSDLAVDGAGHLVEYGLRNHGDTSIDSVAFSNIVRGSRAGVAVASFGGTVAGGGGAGTWADSHLSVTNSTFDNIGRISVFVKGTGATADISGNIFTGKGAGDFLDYAVEIGASASANIIDNVITGNLGQALNDGSTSAGILVTSYYGGASSAVIEGNIINGNTTGVHVGYGAGDVSSVSLRGNDLSGNGTGLALTSLSATADASGNWWGSDNDATIAAYLGGAQAGAIDFSTFLSTGADTNAAAGFQGDFSNLTVTALGGQTGTGGRIQEAVEMADAGGTVNVGDGAFAEHVVVNKADLTLRSVNQYGAVIDAGGTGVGIQVSSAHGALGTVTIDGFSVTNWNTGGIVQGMAAGPLATVHVLNNEVVGPLGGSAAHGNGIQVSGDGSSVIGNTVSVAHLNSADWSGSGILVVNGSNILVAGNTVSDADVGIGVMNYNNAAGMTGVVIEDNLVSGASEGVSIQAYGGQIGGVAIVNNDIGGNDAGLGVWDFGSGEGVWADTIGSIAGNTFHDNTVHASSDFVDAAVVSLLAGNDFDRTVHATGGSSIYGDLAFAVADAAAGSELNLSADTFTLGSTLTIDRSMSLVGAGRDSTIIDGSAINGYGMLVNADDVSLSGFTFDGNNSTSSSHYGIKVQPDTNVASDRVHNFAISDVTIQGWGGSELDLNGVIGATIDGVIADGEGTKGVGIAITDSADVTITNSTTLNNLWGSVALYQKNAFYDQQTIDIHIDADENSFNEFLGVFAQMESVNGTEFGDLYLTNFNFIVQNVDHRADGDQFAFFRTTQQDAIDFAIDLNPAMAGSSVIGGWDGTDLDGNFYVGTGGTIEQAMSIAAAVNMAQEGDTVRVLDGDYVLSSTLNVDDSITLTGNGQGATFIDASGVSGYGIHVTADGVQLAGFTMDGPAANAGSSYGIKVNPANAGDHAAVLDGFTISDVTVRGSGRAELDLNGVRNAVIDGFTADGQGTRGAGIQITDSDTVVIRNSTTVDNAWGGVALYMANTYYDQQLANILIEGSNDFQEVNSLFYQGTSSLHDAPENITIEGYSHVVLNDEFRAAEGDWAYFQKSLQDAVDFALNLDSTDATTDASWIQGWDGTDGTDDFYVGVSALGEAMSIQTAFNQSDEGDAVHVGSGAYAESASLDGVRSLYFETVVLGGLELTADAAGSGLLGDLTATTDGFNLAGSVNLLGDTRLTATGGAIHLAGVDAGQSMVSLVSSRPSLTVNGAGVVSLGPIGQTAALETLTVVGGAVSASGATTVGSQSFTGATVDLSGDYATAGGDFTVAGAASLSGGVAIATADGDVSLDAVDGGQTLTIDAGDGSVALGAVGSTTALASLSVNGGDIATVGATTLGGQSYTAANVTLAGGYATDGGTFTVAGNGVLSSGVTIATADGDVSLDAVDGGQALAIDAGDGSVALGAVGSNAALTSLSVSGGAIHSVGAQTTGSQAYEAAAIRVSGVYATDGGDFSLIGLTTLDGATGIATHGGAAVLGDIDGASAGGQSLTIDAGSATLGSFGETVRLGAVLVSAGQTVLDGSVYAGDSLAFLGSDADSTVRLTRALTTFNSTRSASAAGDITIVPHLIGTTAGAQSVAFIAGSGAAPASANGDVSLTDLGSDALRLGGMSVAGDDLNAQTVKLAGDYASVLSGNQVFSAETLDALGNANIKVDGDESGSIKVGGSVVIESGGTATGNLIAGGTVNILSGGDSNRDIDAGGGVILVSGASIGGSVVSGGDVDLTALGPIATSITTPGGVTIASGQLVDIDIDAGSLTIDAPGGTIVGVFDQITTGPDGTFLVNDQIVVGSGDGGVRQTLINQFLGQAGGLVGSNGQIQLPVNLAIALIAPAGEGQGARRPIVVNSIERLGELLRLGYTAIIVQLDEREEYEQELDIAAEGEAGAVG